MADKPGTPLDLERLTGRFRADGEERAYLRESWSDIAARARVTGIVGGGVFFLATLTDYQSLGLGPAYFGLLAGRLLVLLAALHLVRVATVSRPGPERLEPALLLFIGLMAVVFPVIVAVQGGDVLFHTLSAQIIAAAYLFFVPQLSLRQLAMAPVFSIVFVVVASVALDAGVRELTVPVLLLVVVNAFGLQWVRTTHRHRRTEHRDLYLLRDLNERLRHEIAEREAAEAAARVSEANFRGLFDAAPLPMVLTRARDGAILRHNQAALTLFGAPAEAVPGLTTLDFYEEPAERDRLRRTLADDGFIHAEELAMRRFDGEPIWVMLSGARVDYDGETAFLIGIVDITERKQSETHLQHLATTDSLTGAHNRGFFLEAAERELQRMARQGRPASLIIADLDHFKTINDHYGHATGDEVLREVVARVKEHLRDYDVFGRLGGEEFGILLPEMDAVAAAEVAERLRLNIADRAVTTTVGELAVTSSFGVACAPAESGDVKTLLARADAALYRAKAEGRNRVAADAT